MAIEGFVAHLAACEDVGDRVTNKLAHALSPVAAGVGFG
jgi:hypothetical protein